jgi:hypothetical protein
LKIELNIGIDNELRTYESPIIDWIMNNYWASFFISASFLSIIALNEEKGCAPFSISGLEPSLLFTITNEGPLGRSSAACCLRI